MMKGLFLPGILATLLSAQGAFAALFTAGTYAISPDINAVDYLAAIPDGNVTSSESPYYWIVEPSNGRWTIQSEEGRVYLGRTERYEYENGVELTYNPQEWKIEQHERREGTWRIVRPQSPDHPGYGDISVLTYHDSSLGHDTGHLGGPLPFINVHHLEFDSKPTIVQYWRFTRL